MNRILLIVFGCVGFFPMLLFGLVLFFGVIGKDSLRSVGLDRFLVACGVGYAFSVITAFIVSAGIEDVRSRFHRLYLGAVYSAFLFPFFVSVCFLLLFLT